MEMFKRICEISVNKRLFNPIISTTVSGRGREKKWKTRERKRKKEGERDGERKDLIDLLFHLKLMTICSTVFRELPFPSPNSR